jgi:predicted translin family RNA/ssDNA-binding protein
MLKKSALQKIAQEYQQQQHLLGQLKKLSEDIRVSAKSGIALLRRRHDRAAHGHIRQAEKSLRRTGNLVKRKPSLSQAGFFREAVEEYVEAKALQSYLTRQALIFPPAVEIPLEEKIGGLSDFSGELVRRAITIAARKTRSEIEEHAKFVSQMTEIFAKISFSGKLRNKYDALEKNLKRLEEILYQLRLNS